MEPRISLITLGVSDLNVSLAFYRDGLELQTDGIVGTEYEEGEVVFFPMNDQLVLALYSRTALAKDAALPLGPPVTAGFSLSHNVDSREKVDEIMNKAEQAGATITDRARDRFWGGYSGYFLDPDGHLWEIAWNPDWPIEE